MTTLLRRCGAFLTAVAAMFALVFASGLATPEPAAATVAPGICDRPDLKLHKDVHFKRGSKTLDYAMVKVYRASNASNLYCIQIGSEFKRTIWVKGTSCTKVKKKWSCQAGYDYVVLGTGYALEDTLTIAKKTNRQSVTYRLKTAAGNYYEAKVGYLYYD